MKTLSLLLAAVLGLTLAGTGHARQPLGRALLERSYAVSELFGQSIL